MSVTAELPQATTPVRFLERADGPRLAFRHHAPRDRAAATLVFLPGYMSDMAGSKAEALLAQAEAGSHGCLLLDYSGCGQSGGRFADGTLGGWCDEVVLLVRTLVAQGAPVVLAGSSMGGWLMWLVARALGPQVRAMIGVAAAPDFTDWGTSADDKTRLAAGETVYEDNPYGPEPTPTHPGFWADGQARRVLGDGIGFAGPVRLVHGQRDADVPWELALTLAAAVGSDDVQVTLIKDGDHRLSRAQDIAVLLRVAGECLAASPTLPDLPQP